MIIRAIAFTKNGTKQLESLVQKDEENIWELFDPETISYSDFLEESFRMKSVVLFVGAMGIAVRMLIPFAKDKLSDSPVIVMDEAGQYVIPVLSGHVGGANRYAKYFAKLLSAEPVITTATDVNHLFSVDCFAVENGMEILNREGIRFVSGKLLEEGSIRVFVSEQVFYDKAEVPKEIIITDKWEAADVIILASSEEISDDVMSYKKDCLILKMKPFILGMGCRKGMEAERIQAVLKEAFSENKIAEDVRIAFLATIDLKKKEYGLVRFAGERKLLLRTFSAEELRNVPGDFSESQYVEKTVGVSNVCERAAMCLAGEGELIMKKFAKDGVTAALVKRKEVIRWWKKTE